MCVFPEKYTKPELQGLSSAGGLGWHAKCVGGGGPGTGANCTVGPGPTIDCSHGPAPFGIVVIMKSGSERFLDPDRVGEGL